MRYEVPTFQAGGLFLPNVNDSFDSVIVTGFSSSPPPRRVGTFKTKTVHAVNKTEFVQAGRKKM